MLTVHPVHMLTCVFQ